MTQRWRNTGEDLHVPYCHVAVGGDNVQNQDILATAPVWVTLRAPLDTAARPVVWDGRGAWSEEGCTFSRTLGSLVVFQCTRLGYFALRQDLAPPLSAPLGCVQ